MIINFNNDLKNFIKNRQEKCEEEIIDIIVPENYGKQSQFFINRLEKVFAELNVIVEVISEDSNGFIDYLLYASNPCVVLNSCKVQTKQRVKERNLDSNDFGVKFALNYILEIMQGENFLNFKNAIVFGKKGSIFVDTITSQEIFPYIMWGDDNCLIEEASLNDAIIINYNTKHNLESNVFCVPIVDFSKNISPYLKYRANENDFDIYNPSALTIMGIVKKFLEFI